MFNFNLIEKLKIILNFGQRKKSEAGKGGDAGEIFITARKIKGSGKTTADGGDGITGGRGGKVTVVSEDNQFKGEISTKGGKSLAENQKIG